MTNGKLVSEFLEGYSSPRTRRNYKGALNNFFATVYGESTYDKLDQLARKYFSEKRNIEEDIIAFAKSMSSHAPLTFRLKLAAIRVFFSEQDVEFKKKFWKKLNRLVRGNSALTLDRIPSNKELRKIIMHCPVNGKALYLMLASSGMRIGETLELRLDDVELADQLVRIQLRGKYPKSGNPRYAFASVETKDAVEEWLKVRGKYLKEATAKSRYAKSMNDDRLFPFDVSTARIVWNNALDKAGFNGRDSSTKRHRLHPHSLRKFFRTRMATVVPVDVVEALMGHSAYLTDVYRKHTVEDLEKFYTQGQSTLLVFAGTEEVGKLRVEIEEGKKQLQTLVNGLTAKSLKLEQENMDLKNRIQLTEQKLAELEKLIKEALES